MDDLPAQVDNDQGGKEILKAQTNNNNQPVPFLKALTIPGVPLYCIAYSCVKSTTYGILFWLSPYLKDNHLDDVI